MLTPTVIRQDGELREGYGQTFVVTSGTDWTEAPALSIGATSYGAATLVDARTARWDLTAAQVSAILAASSVVGYYVTTGAGDLARPIVTGQLRQALAGSGAPSVVGPVTLVVGPPGAAGDPTTVADGAIPQAKVNGLTAGLAGKLDSSDVRITAPVAFNVKAFGAAGDGVTDDTAAINSALAYVTKGQLFFPKGIYLVSSPLVIAKTVSLLGDGPGKGEQPSTAATTIKYTGTDSGVLCTFNQVAGITIRNILFDGNNLASTGLYFDRLRSSQLSNVSVARCTTLGIMLTTAGTTAADNSMFNVFTEVELFANPIGIRIDGDTANLANSCHNSFIGLRVMYSGAYGVQMGNADNNTFLDLMTSRTSGTGYGIGFVGDLASGTGVLARSNYLYHIQATAFARTGSKDNFILGYDQENAQGEPVVESGADLNWMGNAGAVQQKFWSINRYIQAPNIVQPSVLTNGAFNVWTYGTSLSAVAANVRWCPRWQFWYNNTTTTNITREAFTKGQTEVPGNPRYFAKISITATTATAASLTYHTEGADTLNGEYVRLTFYARSDAVRTLNSNLVQNFGTGGSPSSSVSTSAGNIALTTNWTKYSFFVLLPSVAGKTFGTNGDDSLDYTITYNGAVSDVMLAQFKLERGIKDSPYLPTKPAIEEASCARYAQTITAQIGTTDTVIHFSPMAKIPTVTGGGTGFTVNANGTNYIRCYQTTAGMQTLTLRAE